MVSGLINADPVVYERKERHVRSAPLDRDEYALERIDQQEVFDHVRDIKDPEHPYSLEELKVVSEDAIEVNDEQSHVSNTFTPTVKHCSMATVIGIGLCLCVNFKLMRSLPSRYKARPTLGRWRYQAFPLYEEMAMLMGDSHATGDLAFTYNELGYANYSTPTATTEVDPLNFCPTTDNANLEGDASSPSIHTRGVNPPNERAKKRKKKDSEEKLINCFEAMNQTLARMIDNEERECKELTTMKDIVLALPDIDITIKLSAMALLARDNNLWKLFLDLDEEYRGLFLLNVLRHD